MLSCICWHAICSNFNFKGFVAFVFAHQESRHRGSPRCYFGLTGGVRRDMPAARDRVGFDLPSTSVDCETGGAGAPRPQDSDALEADEREDVGLLSRRPSGSGASSDEEVSGSEARSSDDSAGGLADYIRVLRENAAYRFLFLSSVVSEAGNWFSYVAQLELIQRLAPGRTYLLTVLLVVRLLPSALLSPFTGALADALPRAGVMVSCDLLACAVTAAMALIGSPAMLPAFFLLLGLQCSLAAQYDPAKRALLPSLVPPADLKVASTLEGFSWSVMLAIGAALGGVTSARLGTGAAFLIDAATFLAAAACVGQVARLQPARPPAGLGGPAPAPTRSPRCRGDSRRAQRAPLT